MRFPYSFLDDIPTELRRMPLLSCTLRYEDRTLEVKGLVDSGAAVNVLPYQVGVELGAVWDDKLANLSLGGAYANIPTMPIIVYLAVGDLDSVRLVFNWTKSNNVRILLGQFNFFQEFDVHFYRSQFEFEINPKSQ